MNPAKPEIKVPLDDFVRAVAREAALAALKEHETTCPIVDVERRVTRLERRFIGLVAFLFGASSVGGFLGGLLAQLTG